MAELAVADFMFGFPIHYKGDRISSHSTNLVSALQNPEVGDLNIEKLELVECQLVGPSTLPCTIPYFPGVSADFCTYVRVPIAPEKTCGPATTLSFAEMQLDTLMLEARLSADKTLICKDTILIFFREKRPL